MKLLIRISSDNLKGVVNKLVSGGLAPSIYPLEEFIKDRSLDKSPHYICVYTHRTRTCHFKELEGIKLAINVSNCKREIIFYGEALPNTVKGRGYENILLNPKKFARLAHGLGSLCRISIHKDIQKEFHKKKLLHGLTTEKFIENSRRLNLLYK